MKQCPKCSTTYTDDSLSYCLSDGASLTSAKEDEQTVVRRIKNDGVRVEVPGPTPTMVSQPASSTIWIKVLVAALILGILALAGLGLAGAAFYVGTSGKPAETPVVATPSPRPSQSATPDAENERLKDEIANIQKQLEQQKKNANTWNKSEDDDQRGSAITATVDSPNDGFLALRSEPDPDRGARIAKIPHGAEVEIQNCEKNAVTIAGRSGRWCQVDYNGLNGWVFDAWLEY